MRHKLDTIAFAQGWLGSQLDHAAADNAQLTEAGQAVAAQVLEQWKIIDEGLDDLVKINTELTNKLNLIKNAF
jgi:hypothetical protein